MANEFKIRKGLIVEGASGGVVVNVLGSQGQLLSVTDDLSGSIFAVSDISGVPIFTVNSSGLSTFDGSANFTGTIGIGTAPTTNAIEINGVDGSSYVYFKSAAATTGARVGLNSDDLIIENKQASGDIIFDTAATERLRIASGGAANFTGDVVVNNSLSFDTNGFADFGNIGTGAMRFKPSGNTLALTLTGTNATIVGKATSAQTAASDSSITLTTKSYVDGLVTGVPVYKGTWDARTQAEGGLAGDGGNPNLRLAANKILGNYYIVSTAGSATPNGAGTQPDSWNVGDWCIFSDVTPGTGTDLWQKIDNTSVISGAGTGQKVTKWEGAGPSETLTDGPITFSSNDSTFAGQITTTQNQITTDIGTTSAIRLKPAATTDSGGKSSIFLGTSTADNYGISLRGARNSGAGAPTFELATHNNSNNGTVALSINNSQDATFAGSVTAVGVSSTIASATSGYFATGTAIPANQILHVRDNVGQVATNSAGGIKISSSPGNDVFLLKRNDGGTSYFALQNSSGTEFITTNMASGNTTFAGDVITSLRLKSIAADTNTNVTASSSHGISLQNTSNTDGNFVPIDFFNSSGFVTARIGAQFNDAGDRNTDLYFCTRANSGSLAEKMRITSSGNVGIGTTSPGGKLTVADGETSGVSKTALEFIPQDANDRNIIFSYDRVSSVYRDLNIDANDVRFNNGGTEKMRITSAGNVGIGVTGPSAKLHVSGKDDSGAGNLLNLQFDNSPADTGLVFTNIFDTVKNRITMESGDTDRLMISSIKDIRFYTATVAQQDANLRMSIANDGNVGIGVGTTDAVSKLQVAGGIQMADDTDTASVTKVGTMRYRTATDEAVPVTGTELVTNGNFSNGTTGWSFSPGWAVSNGGATVSTTSVTTQISQALSYVANISSATKFRYRFEITDITAGSLRLFVNKPTFTQIANVNAVGVYEYVVEVSTGSNGIFYLYSTNSGGSTFQGTVTNVSVLEVTEEDASYADMCMQTGSSTYEWVNIVRNTY